VAFGLGRRSGEGVTRPLPHHRDIPQGQRSLAKHLRSHQTKLEDRLWHELRAGRLDGWKFKRQAPIERYIVDFVCFEARLIVEVDGPLHLQAEKQLKDIERDAALRKQGFRILRFDGEMALGSVVDEIRRSLK
jgi:very-short-patch-repair endonuclease